MLEQRFPCSLWSRLWWGRLCPCSPWRSTVEQISTCSPGTSPCWSRWMPKKGCEPLGSLCWSRLLPGPVAPWREEPTLEHADPEGLQPIGRTNVGEVSWRRAACGSEPTLEQGQSVRSYLREDRGMAETTRDELTTTLIPCPPATVGWREGREYQE